MTFPKNAVLELTYKCNHRCLFCSCPWENESAKYNSAKELSIEEWKRAIQILLDCGVKVFSVSGGEAIVREGAKDIIRHIRASLNQRGIQSEITLISNGLALSQDWLDFFKQHNVHLSISLPGLKTFSKHTGVDNVNGVLRWFGAARDLGLKTTANITVTKLNIGELRDTIAAAFLNGAYDILLNRFLPGGRGLTHMKELVLSTKELNQMLDDAEYVLELANKYGNVGTEIALCSIDEPTKYKRLHIGYKCAAATGFFVVGPSGEIRTSNHSPKIVGHIFHPGLITDMGYWKSFAEDKIQPQECNDCIGSPICSCGCREVAHILSSKIESPDSTLSLSHKSIYH